MHTVPETDGCVNLYDWCRNGKGSQPNLPGNPTLSPSLTCSYFVNDKDEAIEGKDYENLNDTCRNHILPKSRQELMVEFSCANT